MTFDELEMKQNVVSKADPIDEYERLWISQYLRFKRCSRKYHVRVMRWPKVFKHPNYRIRESLVDISHTRRMWDNVDVATLACFLAKMEPYDK